MKFIARVCLRPTNYNTPKRLVIEAETEADARKVLDAEGYNDEFRWSVQSVTPYVAPPGRILSDEIQ